MSSSCTAPSSQSGTLTECVFNNNLLYIYISDENKGDHTTGTDQNRLNSRAVGAWCRSKCRTELCGLDPSLEVDSGNFLIQSLML